MKTLFTLMLAVCLVTAAAGAQTSIDRQAALDAIVSAERAFAKTSLEKGIREAFLEYLADDAIALEPDPVPAKEPIRARPAGPGYLTWYPVDAGVSLAGDLGYTTGPYELRPGGKDDTRVIYGYYSTVWQKQADGSYKAFLDFGIQSPQSDMSAPVKIPPAVPAKIGKDALPKATGALDSMLAADRAFGKAAEKGDAQAYATVLADHARLHRTGAQPYVGKAAILAALSPDPKPLSWEPAGGRVAQSGDFGVTYGKIKRRQSGPDSPWVESDSYAHYWRRQGNGPWKLILEVANPIPPKPPVEKPRKPEGGS
ncbi:MAG TPA: nuclear transport factor 2 family protein [Thermoanaerobaculia bacterium]|nr:nuclear transport factor 2 family protein [Thermoanaerobaculia bacterium]